MDEPDYVIEEAAGKVYPTTAPAAENNKEQSSPVTPETMPPAESSARHEGEGEAAAAGQTGQSAGQAGQSAGQSTTQASQPTGQTTAPSEAQTTASSEAQTTAPSKAQTASSPTGEGTAKASRETVSSSKEETAPPATGARADASAETVSAVNYSVYTVEDGETLYGICFKLYHNLKHIDEICRVNALTDENSIFAGQKLLVP